MTGRQIDVLGCLGGGEGGGPLGPTAALLKLHLPDCKASQLHDTRTASLFPCAHKLIILVEAEVMSILFLNNEVESHTLAYV